MCRLALLNNSGIKYIKEKYSLLEFFDYLQSTFGGHGNGICIINDDNSFYIKKGVQLTNEKIIEIIDNNISNLKWIIYHTRLASIGKISNANCHPFKLRNNVLCMNGTEYWAVNALNILNRNMTDTELILKLSNKNLYDSTKRCKSVFIGLEEGKVFANRNNGSLKYIDTNTGGKIFSSDFPENIVDSEQIYIAPKHWIEGEKIYKKNLTRLKDIQYIKTKYDYPNLDFVKYNTL